MSWNYRVVKAAEGFSVYEVFYDEAGEPSGYAERPALSFFCETAADVLAELEVIKTAWNKPVLDLAAIGKVHK